MNLYLLRHGPAVARDPARYPDDALRPLNERGKEQVRKIAEAMARAGLDIDLIWFSPLLRTRQTAAAVAKRFDPEHHARAHDQLAPDGDPRKLLGDLAGLDPEPANLLLVGHEPYLSELLSVVTCGGLSLRTEIKKGGLAKLEIDGRSIRFGQCATLKWLLPPRLIVMLG